MKLLSSLSIVVTLALTSACSKSESKAPTCEQVTNHTLSIMPKEFSEGASKDDMIKKCEKTTPAQRACAMAAKDMAGLMDCGAK